MQHKTKRNHELFNLIRNFEERIHSGTLIYLEENETLQLIEYYEKESMLDYAIKVVDLAICNNPYRTEYYLLKSRLYSRMEDSEKALITIDEALTYSPLEYDLLFMKARILTDFKNYVDAMEILSTLKMRSHGVQKTQLILQIAYIYELQHNYDIMYRMIKEAVIHDPTSQVALKRMWVAVEITKNYSESAEIHESIVELSPYNYLAWFNLGHAYACQGRYEESVNALEYSFLIKPTFEAAYADCSDMCIQIGRYQQALEVQLEQLERFGPESSILVEISESLIALHRSSDAFQYLYKALKLDTYNDEIYFNLARAYANERNWQKVINNMKKAIEIEQRREEYYALLADAYVEIDSFTYADYYYRKATETGPEDPAFWIKHVQFLIKIHEYNAAIEVLDEASINTYSPELECAMVALLFKCKERDKAISLLEVTIQDCDFNAEVLYSYAPELKEDDTVQSLLFYFDKY